MKKEVIGSLKELLIHIIGISIGAVVTFPTLLFLSIAEIPKVLLYTVAVLGILGPVLIIENKRRNINFNLHRQEVLKWENFAKMKRPGWPWNKDIPLTPEEYQKYM